jgi:predicted negative regulator of RcsB-dependent stress response
MKSIISIVIAFVIGVGVGAYRWRNTVKSKALSIAEQAYTQGIESVVQSGSDVLNAQLQVEIEKLKAEGEARIRESIEDQIKGIFSK